MIELYVVRTPLPTKMTPLRYYNYNTDNYTETRLAISFRFNTTRYLYMKYPTERTIHTPVVDQWLE